MFCSGTAIPRNFKKFPEPFQGLPVGSFITVRGMKKPIRITKLTIERERTLIFRTFGGRQPHWCDRCGAEAQMTSVAEAAREAGSGELAIYQLLDSGVVHFMEDPEGRVLVCLNSLLK